MAKKARPRKLKQTTFSEGVDGTRIAALEKAADDYVAVRDERMEAGRLEVTRADTLMRKMKEHHVTEYEYDGKVITLKSLEKVKVKKMKGEEED